MFLKKAIMCLLFVLLLTLQANAQPWNRHLNMKAQILDRIFPLSVESTPYYIKIVMRFGDSDSQFIIITYAGGLSELYQYTLDGMNNGALDEMIRKMEKENPDIKVEDIVSKLKVKINRSSLDSEKLFKTLESLKKVKITPFFQTRAILGDANDFEYWFDTGTECVYYSIQGPSKGDSQDELVQWMIHFRAKLAALILSAK
jgi:hypothetical protein